MYSELFVAMLLCHGKTNFGAQILPALLLYFTKYSKPLKSAQTKTLLHYSKPHYSSLYLDYLGTFNNGHACSIVAFNIALDVS